MSTLVHSTQLQLARLTGELPPALRRALGAGVAILLVITIPGAGEATLTALSDAYLAVSVFVAGTLALFYGAERLFKGDLGIFLHRYRRWQVPIAALLGAVPGCGGAIIAVTQFSRGYLSFGAVVATLTATMGDAMFLLLAQEPDTAVGILALSLVVGVLSGWAVDAVHGARFMHRRTLARADNAAAVPRSMRWTTADRLWVALIVPGFLLGVLGAFQWEPSPALINALAFDPVLALGAVGAGLTLTLWIRNGSSTGRPCTTNACATEAREPVARRVIDDTNTITAWVVLAFVGYELLVVGAGLDLGALLAVWAPLVPAMAVLVGFIPGCGPQILVTSLYLSGAAPLSAQLGNAIANDGDALLPAIAVAPRAALLATLYSAIPAFLVAYAWFFLMEGGG